jgi:hypothetical protein
VICLGKPFLRAFHYLFLMLFSVNFVHAETALDQQPADLLPEPPRMIRMMYKEIPWPEIKIDAEKIFSSEAEFIAMSEKDKIDKIVTYCRDIAKDYGAKAKNKLQLKIIDSYFSDPCYQVPFLMRSSNAVNEFKQTGKINIILLNLFDASYSYVYKMPFYSFWKNEEEATNSYLSSIFGVVGIPLKFSHLVLQVLALVALIFSIFGFLKK